MRAKTEQQPVKENLDPLSETVVEIIEFLTDHQEMFANVDIKTSAQMNKLLFSLAQKMTKVVTAKFHEMIEKLWRIIIPQVRNFIDLVEKSADEDEAETRMKDLKSQLEEDLRSFAGYFVASKSFFLSKLEKFKFVVGANLAGYECRKLFQRARALEADNLPLRSRVLIGSKVIAILQRAEKILAPFSTENPNLMGKIMTFLGQTHLDLLQDLDAAKEAFESATALEDEFCLGRPLPTWCSEASAGLRKIAHIQGKGLENVLSELNAKFKQSILLFIDFILICCPPKHCLTFDQEIWKGQVDKKLLIKLMSFYHPDKVDRSKVGEDNFKIFEEISKLLGNKLQGFKESKA